jgi:hypothetical protein
VRERRSEIDSETDNGKELKKVFVIRVGQVAPGTGLSDPDVF